MGIVDLQINVTNSQRTIRVGFSQQELQERFCLRASLPPVTGEARHAPRVAGLVLTPAVQSNEVLTPFRRQ